jgi:hypothetical protein
VTCSSTTLVSLNRSPSTAIADRPRRRRGGRDAQLERGYRCTSRRQRPRIRMGASHLNSRYFLDGGGRPLRSKAPGLHS